MAREGLFASLGAIVDRARWLDLYAGTGAAGIEALSRGAIHATFVDRDARAAATVRENLRRTRLEEAATVIRTQVGRFLDRSPEPFDIVLLDPPYATEATAVAADLRALGAGWLAAEGWIVVVTRGHKSPLPAVPLHWAVRRQLRYGDSLLIQYREER
jgi:16S rRNA (guanine966-N2)-methyltransferase